jgi:hypothetical protein
MRWYVGEELLKMRSRLLETDVASFVLNLSPFNLSTRPDHFVVREIDAFNLAFVGMIGPFAPPTIHRQRLSSTTRPGANGIKECKGGEVWTQELWTRTY